MQSGSWESSLIKQSYPTVAVFQKVYKPPNRFRKHDDLDLLNAPAPDSSNSLSSNLIGGGESTSLLSSKTTTPLSAKREELGLLDSIFGAGTQSRILDSIYRWFEARVRANPGCVRRFVCETYREASDARFDRALS